MPGELVDLFASVSYIGKPVPNASVTFQVWNSANNVFVIASSLTNASGMAECAFTLPVPTSQNSEGIFGTWTAQAVWESVQPTVNDWLTFQVGWILQITRITLPQTTFFRQETMHFNLTVQSIAMEPVEALILVNVTDALGQQIYLSYQLLIFPPLESENVITVPLSIPDTAASGNATVCASIYTTWPINDGTEFSPPFLSEIEIANPHDVAITNITPSKALIVEGNNLNINVTVNNSGGYNETFSVTAYANTTAIATQTSTLAIGTITTITFTWNTNGFACGNYTISANVTLASGETNVWTGPFTYGMVTVKAIYEVSLVESGLPHGEQWSVTFNGQTRSSTSNSITFNATNGVYPFSVSTPFGYVAWPPSGSITVNGANVAEQIMFIRLIPYRPWIYTFLLGGGYCLGRFWGPAKPF
jgi:hypothetical protein